MYLFYQQEGGTESWKSCEDTKRNRRSLAERKVAFISALAVSVKDPKPLQDPRYSGDLYFDIDSDDLSKAIQVGKNLIDKLKSLEVQDYSIFLSGKKGLHVTVPFRTFCMESNTMYLPLIYSEMATQLEVLGLDMAVYSCKKGRLWRQPNVLRDNGKYKVQIVEQELAGLTVEGYDTLVSSPRDLLPEQANPTFCPKLELIYESAIVEVRRQMESVTRYELKDLPELEGLKEVPGCITKLVTQKSRPKGCNFNMSAMSLARYIRSSKMEKPEFFKLAKLMAKNGESSTYNTYRKRLSHILSQIFRALSAGDMGYSQGYMLAAIGTPCGDCILCDGTLSEHFKDEKKVAAEADENMPVFEYDHKTFIQVGKTEKVIANFTVTPIAESCTDTTEDFQGDGNTPLVRRAGNIHCIAYKHQGKIKSFNTYISEDDWNSVSRLRQCVSGVDNIAYRGNDTDSQDFRSFVFSKEVDMDSITRLEAVGLSLQRVDKHSQNTMLVYAEPGYSINHFGDENTHEVNPHIDCPPRLFAKKVKPADKTDADLVKACKVLCEINDPQLVCMILGWFVACHFKPHFMSINNQFPLIALWGKAGSGKTKTVELMSNLHGQDLAGADAMMTCPGSTPWGLANYCATSTSTPRYYDEFNEAKLKGKYSQILDIFKGCYGQQASAKGQLKAGATSAVVAKTILTGPACIMSEEFVGKEPALAQRTLLCQMTTKAHSSRQDNWVWLYENKALLARVGRSIALAAIKTPKSTIKSLMDKHLKRCPAAHLVGDRPRFNMAVALTGCDLYKQVLEVEGIDVSSEIEVLTEGFFSDMSSRLNDIIRTNTRSVVDRTLDIHAQMASASARGETGHGMYQNGSCYIKDEENLVIDIEGTMAMYRKFCKQAGYEDVINTHEEFVNLVKDEPYFISMVQAPFTSGTRLCPRLSVPELKKKGVSVDLFEGDY